jgi:phosphoglycolate phosphatase-like HAD superfamily hydrolase
MNLALDLDGTLITCEPRQSAVLQAALVRCGARVDLNHVWELKRDGFSTENALVKLGLRPKLALRTAMDWRRMIEEPLWLGMDSVLPSVLDVLCKMHEAGASLWLLTARSRREWVKSQLARLGLIRKLDGVVVVPTHESAITKTKVLRELEAAAFFGDTESDWCASIAADVPFYAVSTGQRSSKFLARVGVQPVHADLAAALKAFLSVAGRRFGN